MTERADRIVERGGKFVVMAKGSGREFGSYDTREEAEERLAQIERFAEDEAKERSRSDRAPAVHTEPKTWIEERRTAIAQVRFDRGTPTGNGWMRFEALFSRGDIVKPYRLDGRIVREFLPASEALDPASMDSGIGSPMSLYHPPANLREDTVLGQARGAVLDVGAHEDGLHTAGSFVAWDGEALRFIDERVEAMARGDGIGPELSVGFTLKIDPRSGMHEGERYDRVQRKIRWNHVALVDGGNAKTARVLTSRADADGQILDDLRPLLAARKLERRPFIDLGAWTRHDGGLLVPADTRSNTTMQTIKIDGADYEVPAPVAAHIARQDAAQTEQTERIAELQTQLAERQDAAKGLLPESEVDARADALAREYAEAFELCRLAAGADWREQLPEQRKDAEGAEIPRELGEYLELGIRHAFGERADEVFADIDAAKDRDVALDLYARQARRLVEQRADKVVQIKRTIANAAKKGSERDTEDGLAAAYARQDARAAEFVGNAKKETA